MKTSESIRNNEVFKKQIKILKSKMARANGLKFGQPNRFIHKQANKHRKPNGFFCITSSYLWAATRGNCYFRRKGLRLCQK